MKLHYKFLDIPNHKLISDKLYDYVANHTYVPHEEKFTNPLNVEEAYSYVPELKEALDNLGLEMTYLSIIQSIPGSYFDGGVHIDVGDAIHGARFIWPVYNCIGSETRFFEIPEEFMKFSEVPDGYHAIIPTIPPPYKQIDQYELTAPAAIDTRVPHGVFCDQTNPNRRWSASMTFKVPPDYLLEK